MFEVWDESEGAITINPMIKPEKMRVYAPSFSCVEMALAR